MAKKHESYTVTQLINSLKKAIKDGQIKADSQVFISSDEEGNSMGTIGEMSLGISEQGVIIYPESSIFIEDF